MESETLKVLQTIKTKMADYLDYEKIRQLDCVLTKTLYDYELTPKSREIAIYDDTNDKMLTFFLQTLKLNGRSENTIKQYQRATNKMLETIGKPYNQITNLDVMNYFAHLSNTVSAVSYNNYIHFTGQFFQWLSDEGYASFNPMSKIHKVKEEQKIKKAFSDSDIACLLDNANYIRDKAIIQCLYSTGCRVSELCSIDIKDINEDGTLIIYGQKSKKERTVCIDDRAMYYLKQYMTTRKDDNPALFVSIRKDVNGYPHRITKGGVEDMTKKLGKKCGIENCHPHRFRRTCATRGLNKGMGIEKMQRYLGHSNIDTTTIYYDYTQTDIVASHRMYLS